MNRLITKALDILAPKVCDACDQGTGTVYDEEAGQIVSCTVCGGSGRPLVAVTKFRRDI